MELEERERIRAHLHSLVTFTICSAPLLSFLHEKNILGFADIDEITSRRKEADKASQLYRLVQTKVDGFAHLISALELSGQPGIVHILLKGEVPPGLEVSSRVRKLLYEGYPDSQSKRTRLEPVPLPSNIQFGVEPPVRLFTGRRKELDDLRDLLKDSSGSSSVTVVSQLTSISGLGGIGKTQLCRQHILERVKLDYDGNCIWLPAQTSSGLEDSFLTLAKDHLGLPTRDANGTQKDIKSVISQVYQFFQGCKALFVFDNAERAPWLKQYLPGSLASPGITVLITSRIREWDRGITVMPLDELSADALALVRKGLELKEDDHSQDEVILKLVRRLQCFPLALQQAISYILDQQVTDDYSVEEYLQDFERSRLDLLSFQGDGDLLNDYTLTTFTTWKMTVDKIGQDQGYGPVAIKALYAMAYLSPDKIKRELLSKLPEVPNEGHLKSAIRLLVKYSMVNGEDKQRLLSIHRLVQEVTRIQLGLQAKEGITLEGVLLMLLGEEGKPTLALENLEHCLTTWGHLWSHKQLIEKWSLGPSLIVKKLYDKGRYAEAIQFGSDAVDKLGALLGPDHDSVLATENAMGGILRRQGKMDEALEKLEKVVEKRKLLFGEDDNRTLTAQLSLAFVLESRRDMRAVPMIREVFEKRKRLLGEGQLDTLKAEADLGVSLEKAGEFKEAKSIMEQLIPKYQKLLGEGHSDVLLARQNKAVLLDKMGRFSEALEEFRQVYVELGKAPEQNVSLIQHVGSNLGEMLDRNGEYEEALKVLEENLAGRRETLGEEHAGTLRVMGIVGTVLRHKGRGRRR